MKNKAKRAGGIAQMMECLHKKCEALSSNPSTPKNLKKKKNLVLQLSALFAQPLPPFRECEFSREHHICKEEILFSVWRE
jgi:hypothetical protein